MKLDLSRRQFVAAIPAIGLVGCDKKRPIVTIVYKPLVNFHTFRHGENPSANFSPPTGGIFSMIEIVRIENISPDTKFGFVLDTSLIDMKGGGKAGGFWEHLKGLVLGGPYQDAIQAGTVQNYPKPQPILEGPWCQTRQHLRMTFVQSAEIADKHGLGALLYKNPGSTHGVVMGRQQPTAPIPYYDEITPAQIIDTVLAGTFMGNCGSQGGGNQGGGNQGGGGTGTPQTYTFCATPPGSGPSPVEFTVTASAPTEALAKLKKEHLSNDGIGWDIASGKCPVRNKPA